MRRLIAWVLGWQVVYLVDHDGFICKRLAQPTPHGWMAWRMSRLFRIRPVLLEPDGTVRNGVYVESWRPTNGGVE